MATVQNIIILIFLSFLSNDFKMLSNDIGKNGNSYKISSPINQSTFHNLPFTHFIPPINCKQLLFFFSDSHQACDADDGA